MPLLTLTITFIIAALFAKLLDESAGYTANSYRILYGRQNKLGAIVGSIGLVACVAIILFVAVIQ